MTTSSIRFQHETTTRLLGVFESTKTVSILWRPRTVVEELQGEKERRRRMPARSWQRILENQGRAVGRDPGGEVRQVPRGLAAGQADGSLDAETLERWKKYLAEEHQHPF